MICRHYKIVLNIILVAKLIFNLQDTYFYLSCILNKINCSQNYLSSLYYSNAYISTFLKIAFVKLKNK